MQYQRHISEILEPSATAGTTATRSANRIKVLIRNDDQNTFEAAIHIALMKKSISTDLYALLLELSHAGSHKDLICSHLTLDGIALPGVLMFRDKWPQIKHVLYIPDDPMKRSNDMTRMAIFKQPWQSNWRRPLTGSSSIASFRLSARERR